MKFPRTERTVLTSHTPAINAISNKEKLEMAINFNRDAYNKVFDDLERFKAFCATAYLYGHSGYAWDERNMYDGKSRAWQAYQRFRNGGRKNNQNRNNNGQGRYQSNRRS